jgi:phosphoglycerate dehydrogenase-like enzyme
MMPHIAGITYVETAAQAVAEQIKRAERGEPLTNYAADSASRTP